MVNVPSEKAAGIKKNEILETLMPIVERANARTEAFCRVLREMVEILDLNTEYLRTDKGSDQSSIL